MKKLIYKKYKKQNINCDTCKKGKTCSIGLYEKQLTKSPLQWATTQTLKYIKSKPTKKWKRNSSSK